MDRLTPAGRSWNMARIRSKDTLPELAVRSALHRLGYRFRLHARLPGRPDLVFPRYRTALYIHGCFWHAHGCRDVRIPKSNVSYWSLKLRRNRQRDAVNLRAIRKAGWRPVVVWECELERTPTRAFTRILRRLM